jgi:hypothetical protein
MGIHTVSDWWCAEVCWLGLRWKWDGMAWARGNEACWHVGTWLRFATELWMGMG